MKACKKHDRDVGVAVAFFYYVVTHWQGNDSFEALSEKAPRSSF
jgi:hypothetical protein